MFKSKPIFQPCCDQTSAKLSNLRCMPNLVSKDTAMKMGSSRRFKWYPTTYMWVSSWLFLTVDYGLSWFILILSKGKLTWHSPVGCGVSIDLSWWAHFHGRPESMVTEFGIHYRLESCDYYFVPFHKTWKMKLRCRLRQRRKRLWLWGQSQMKSTRHTQMGGK